MFIGGQASSKHFQASSQFAGAQVILLQVRGEQDREREPRLIRGFPEAWAGETPRLVLPTIAVV